MIHKLDNSFVISSNGVWLPGCYDSERAAKYALSFSDDELRQLQNDVNAREPDVSKRMISFEMLQYLKKSVEGQKT